MALGFERSQDLWTEQARFEAQISKYLYFYYSHVIINKNGMELFLANIYFKTRLKSRVPNRLLFTLDFWKCLFISCKTNITVNIEVQVDQLKVMKHVQACTCTLFRFLPWW